MSRILRVYLANIFKQKGYYICLMINFLLGLGLPLLTNIITKSNNPSTVADQLKSVLSVDIISAIFITIFVCSDFTEGAAKNYIARGYTRRQILFTKYIASIIAIFGFFIFNTIVVFLAYSKNGLGFKAYDIYIILGSIVASLATIGFYVIIANTVEKLAIAITINVVGTGFISLIITSLISVLKLDPELLFYWITNLTLLLPNKAGIMDLLKVIVVTGIYLVLLFEISNFIIKKKEVK